MQTIEHAGIQWDTVEGIRSWTPYEREYCADGDGIVRVSQRAKGCFKGFLVFDQMEFAGKHDTLQDALNHAASILKEFYPAIHQELFIEEE